MGVAGSLTYDTKLDTKGFQKGVNDITNKAKTGGSTVKNIVAGLGITKIISSAFNTIVNSLDGAISRFDIMNNFPKVLKNLGFSATDAKNSVSKLSDGLDGLPTALDDAVISVQRLVSKNGDLDKSTEYFLAMNNAILSGGASMTIQQSALEQLTQSYSKGKPDLMEWRTLQMAMPGQLKQVAQAMGYVSDSDLYEAFKAGTVSMDEFMDTIVRLNKEGVNGLASFEAQAKDATGGISTSLTNLKTRIKKGLTTILDNINKNLARSGTSISKIIDTIGTNIKNMLENVGKMIGEVNVNSLIKSLKILAIVVGTVSASMATYNTIIKAIEFSKTAKKVLTLVSSFTELSLPVLAVVTGLTALTGFITLLGIVAEGSVGSVSGLTDKMVEYNKAMKDADQTRQNYLDKNMNEIQNTENLVKELDLLVDENGKVKEGYEARAEYIIGELNGALGTEIKMNDGIIQNYKDMRGEVDKLVESKRAKVLLDAQEASYNTAKDQAVKLEENYTETHKKYNEALKERNSILKQIQQEYGLTSEQLASVSKNMYYMDENGKRVNITFDELGQQLTNANNSLNISKYAFDEAGKAYTNNQQIIYNYEQALQSLADGNYQAVMKMYEDTTNYQGKTNEDTYNNYQVGIEAQKQYLADLQANKSQYDEDFYNKEVERTNKNIENLQNEQAKYKDITREGQEKVKYEWKTGLANQISLMTGHKVEFRKTAGGHIQAYIDGVKEGKPMSKKEAKKFAEEITGEINKNKNNAKIAGENLVQGTTDGINNRNKQSGAFSAISSFGTSLLKKLKSSLKEHSPSKATREMGQFLLEGINLGVDDKKQDVLNNIDDFGEDVLNRMQNAVNVEAGKMSFSGTSGSVTQILNANSSFTGNINNVLELDGEVVYNNQQKITARKNLQRGGVR